MESDIAQKEAEIVRLREEIENMKSLSTKNEDIYKKFDIKEGTLLWRACSSLPCGIVRPHVVRNGSFIYMGGGYTGNSMLTRTVFKYDIYNDSWDLLPVSSCHSFAVVVIDDLITIVGGINIITSKNTNTLLSYKCIGGSKGKWCSYFPSMSFERSCCSALCLKGYLAVIGGINDVDRSYMDSVEVFDVREKQWYKAPSLPTGVSFMSIAASSDSIFLTGGLGILGGLHDVFKCNFQSLIEAAKAGSTEIQIWEKMAKMPFVRSACAIINEKLFIFGGVGANESGRDECQTAIFNWNEESKEWKKIGNMVAKRSSMTVIVTGSHKAMLIGGYNNPQSWTTSLLSDVIELVNIPDL